MKRLNVRCCCQPTTVLGVLQVSERALAARRVTVLRRPETPIAFYGGSDAAPTATVAAATVTADIAPFGPSMELAVYSDDRPIAFWREIEGFEEGAIVPVAERVRRG